MVLAEVNAKNDPKHVVMFVLNDFRPDYRVLKEAMTLSTLGHHVRIFALTGRKESFDQAYGNVVVTRTSSRLRRVFNTVYGTTVKLPFRIARILFRLTALPYTIPRKLGHHFNLIDLPALRPPESFTPMPATAVVQRKGILGTVVAYAHSFGHLGSIIMLYISWFLENRNVKGDVYHAHDLNTLPIAWFLSRKHGAKLVYDSHELYTELSFRTPFEKLVWQMVEKRLIPLADRVITVNDSIGEELVRRYQITLPEVLYNCPPLANPPRGAQKFHTALGICSTEKIVLYQGGYSPNRGLEELICAFSQVRVGVLVMMGWGGIERKLISLAKDRQLDGRVYFLPPVPQEQLLEWTSCADVGVIPYKPVSLNNLYSCPNKLFEYIGAGISIAASNSPELKRFVAGQNLGQLFDPNDPSSIAETLNSMLSDENRLETYKKNSLGSRTQMCWEGESVKLVRLYQNMSI